MPSLQQDLIFGRGADDPCRLLITPAIASELDRFRQVRQGLCEAGGILLGLRRGPHLEVTAVTGPMAGDRRTRTSFLRRDPGHFLVAQGLWRKSNGTIGYIGEWHTHPEGSPSPSYIDTAEWRRILSEERRTTAFIIVGTEKWFVARGPLPKPAISLPLAWEELSSAEG